MKKNGTLNIENSCLVCQCHTLHLVSKGTEWLPAVSSDNKPWNAKIPIYVCKTCGHIQKAINQQWQEDAAAIYAEYDLYKLREGAEHVVVESENQVSRSGLILDHVEHEITLPSQGKLLDFGCGNGSVFRTFGPRHPAWSLIGFDANARYREEVIRLPGVQAFFCGKLDQLEPSFDLMTAYYVMEHVIRPVDVLEHLHHILNASGILCLVVPNVWENAFDLMVADHCSHFFPASLSSLLTRCGYDVFRIATHWVQRSIVVLCRKRRPNQQPLSHIIPDIETIRQRVERRLKWLEELALQALQLSDSQTFGILGTATAGSWLAGVVGDNVNFFVDEDPGCIGKTHLGRPIIAPSEVSDDAVVYLSLPPQLATDIRTRLVSKFPGKRFIVPAIFSMEGF
ncbi:methyltransferase domain-containing protein [candidate division KSB3 bacterium]|uniref:Methyltransferase domain-containing protein n=1 Tax=candidate division KSB3 bacterium TaxID=2044937 RepID=A0A9D5JYC5_9BACT|nr:methyltransferase domain-containing protein [candidate division KSB3 bacterium]MBD3326077.1 methyltransferase domain-containing protein [candidate division KSB3 bacterium]